MKPAEFLNELSNDTLANYKKKASADATASDKSGDTKKADKRFGGIVKATKKQFANDEKGIKESNNFDNLGFNVRSDILWPAKLFETKSPEASENFRNWLDTQRNKTKKPKEKSNCILAMIQHTFDEIIVMYGDAKYIGETETHYILQVPAGTHEYSKKNQIVFNSQTSFDHFITFLHLKYEDADVKITVKKDIVTETTNNYHANRTGFSRTTNHRDDERHDLDRPTQVWGLKINGKVWSKGGVDVTFTSKEAALNARNSILKNKPELEIGLITKGGVAEGDVDASHKKILDREKTKVPRVPKDEYGRKVEKHLKNKYPKEQGIDEELDENLHQWFNEKWVRFGPDGKIRGDCARGDDSEGKPKCLPQSKAHSLGKKGRASAGARKRREDPNPERSGKAINVNTKKKTTNEGVAEAELDELANTSLKVKEPKSFVNVNDRKQVTYKVMKFKSGKDTYLINFTVKGAPAYGKKSNWNAVNVAFGVREEQDDYSFGDEIKTDLTARNKNQFLIYSTVINAVRKFITEYNTEIDEIIMQGAGERQAVMYQRFFQSAGKYFPGWHYNGKHSLVRDVPRQPVKKVQEQGVAEAQHSESCPHCNGPMFSEMIMNEKKDACYYKVKSRYKVWPSAYASGALVKCRKKGASNWGTGGKSNESIEEGAYHVSAFKINAYESMSDFRKWMRSPKKNERGMTRHIVDIYENICVNDKLLTESSQTFIKRRQEAKAFSDKFKQFDERDRVQIKLGNKIALLSTTVIPDDKSSRIELSGFTTPKKIVKINLDNEGEIDSIKFDDGSTFPEAAEFTTVGGVNITNTIFFSDKASASKAHTAIWMYISNLEGKGWKVEHYKSESLVEGPQGNFAGDTPINLGGDTVKRLQVGDTVKYFGQLAKILAMSKTGNTSRITIANDMGGVTKDVLTRDLKRTGLSEEELDEACWKGYHKEGNKKMFGKTYPNCVKNEGVAEDQLDEKWTKKYKDSINCSNPKGFSQKAHCAGKQKNESSILQGLNQIDEGWKEKLGAAALAGSMALGAGAANARVTPDGQGSFTGGLTPTATVTAPSDNKPAAEAPKGFSKEYLQKAADPNRTGRYMISVEKAQELLKGMS